MARSATEVENAILEAYEKLGAEDSPQTILDEFGISRTTLYNMLARNDVLPHARRETPRIVKLPDDVANLLRIFAWHFEGSVDEKVARAMLDDIKVKYSV